MSDPFDDLDEYEDREGDPFAHLDDAAPGVPDEGDGRDDGEAVDDDDDADERDAAFEGGDFDESVDESVAGSSAGSVDVAGDPFGDVDVSRGDPFESADSPFQRVDVDAVDADEVWRRFTEGTDAAAADPPEDDVVTVSKHAFCEGCPHFTAPPDVECTHEGTEILEFVGPDDVRVSNCPIVRERRELGEVHE